MNKGFNNAANQAGVKPSCFVEGTLVMAVTGMVAIENIKAGNKVISTDHETMEIGKKTVVEKSTTPWRMNLGNHLVGGTGLRHGIL